MDFDLGLLRSAADSVVFTDNATAFFVNLGKA